VAVSSGKIRYAGANVIVHTINIFAMGM